MTSITKMHGTMNIKKSNGQSRFLEVDAPRKSGNYT